MQPGFHQVCYISPTLCREAALECAWPILNQSGRGRSSWVVSINGQVDVSRSYQTLPVASNGSSQFSKDPRRLGQAAWRHTRGQRDARSSPPPRPRAHGRAAQLADEGSRRLAQGGRRSVPFSPSSSRHWEQLLPGPGPMNRSRRQLEPADRASRAEAGRHADLAQSPSASNTISAAPD